MYDIGSDRTVQLHILVSSFVVCMLAWSFVIGMAKNLFLWQSPNKACKGNVYACCLGTAHLYTSQYIYAVWSVSLLLLLTEDLSFTCCSQIQDLTSHCSRTSWFVFDLVTCPDIWDFFTCCCSIIICILKFFRKATLTSLYIFQKTVECKHLLLWWCYHEFANSAKTLVLAV